MPLLTWLNQWNDIIRNIIFKDEQLKQLMCIPAGTNIVDFVDKYFIKAGYTNKLLKDQAVRIVYSDLKPTQTDSPNVKRGQMSFDIYVKTTQLRNATRDRLLLRTHLLADRLIHLLTKDGRINGYKFWPIGDQDLGTRTIGYTRYNVSFGYMKVY